MDSASQGGASSTSLRQQLAAMASEASAEGIFVIALMSTPMTLDHIRDLFEVFCQVGRKKQVRASLTDNMNTRRFITQGGTYKTLMLTGWRRLTKDLRLAGTGHDKPFTDCLEHGSVELSFGAFLEAMVHLAVRLFPTDEGPQAAVRALAIDHIIPLFISIRGSDALDSTEPSENVLTDRGVMPVSRALREGSTIVQSTRRKSVLPASARILMRQASAASVLGGGTGDLFADTTSTGIAMLPEATGIITGTASVTGSEVAAPAAIASLAIVGRQRSKGRMSFAMGPGGGAATTDPLGRGRMMTSSASSGSLTARGLPSTSASGIPTTSGQSFRMAGGVDLGTSVNHVEEEDDDDDDEDEDVDDHSSNGRGRNVPPGRRVPGGAGPRVPPARGPAISAPAAPQSATSVMASAPTPLDPPPPPPSMVVSASASSSASPIANGRMGPPPPPPIPGSPGLASAPSSSSTAPAASEQSPTSPTNPWARTTESAARSGSGAALPPPPPIAPSRSRSPEPAGPVVVGDEEEARAALMSLQRLRAQFSEATLEAMQASAVHAARDISIAVESGALRMDTPEGHAVVVSTLKVYEELKRIIGAVQQVTS